MPDLHTPNVQAARDYERDHAHPDLPASHGITAADVPGATVDYCPRNQGRECWACAAGLCGRAS